MCPTQGRRATFVKEEVKVGASLLQDRSAYNHTCSSHNPLISDLEYLVTMDFFNSFLGCKLGFAFGIAEEFSDMCEMRSRKVVTNL